MVRHGTVTKFDRIECRSFALVDDKGRQRVVIDIPYDGDMWASIRLLHRDAEVVLDVAVQGDGLPGITMHDRERSTCITPLEGSRPDTPPMARGQDVVGCLRLRRGPIRHLVHDALDHVLRHEACPKQSSEYELTRVISGQIRDLVRRQASHFGKLVNRPICIVLPDDHVITS